MMDVMCYKFFILQLIYDCHGNKNITDYYLSVSFVCLSTDLTTHAGGNICKLTEKHVKPQFS